MACDLILLKSDLLQYNLPGHRQGWNSRYRLIALEAILKLGFAFEQWVGPWKTSRHRSSMLGFSKKKNNNKI